MTNFKKLGLILLGSIIGSVLLFSFTQKASDANPDAGHYITMMTIEVHGKNSAGSEIEICFSQDDIQHIPLKEYASENRAANLGVITKTLNDIRSKGYKLVNSSVAVTQMHKTELFIFERK